MPTFAFSSSRGSSKFFAPNAPPSPQDGTYERTVQSRPGPYVRTVQSGPRDVWGDVRYGTRRLGMEWYGTRTDRTQHGRGRTEWDSLRKGTVRYGRVWMEGMDGTYGGCRQKKGPGCFGPGQRGHRQMKRRTPIICPSAPRTAESGPVSGTNRSHRSGTASNTTLETM